VRLVTKKKFITIHGNMNGKFTL